MVGEGDGAVVGVSVGPGAGSVAARLSVAVAMLAAVGLGGTVGGRDVDVACGSSVTSLGAQPAKAAPAATAVSLMNVRRERLGRRFIGILRVTGVRGNGKMFSSVYYKRESVRLDSHARMRNKSCL